MNRIDNEDFRIREPISIYGVRQMCIDKQWFTCGTNEQYDKMFSIVKNLAKSPMNNNYIMDIALAIWLCSDNTSREEIDREICFRFNVGNKAYSSKNFCRKLGFKV